MKQKWSRPHTTSHTVCRSQTLNHTYDVLPSASPFEVTKADVEHVSHQLLGRLLLVSTVKCVNSLTATLLVWLKVYSGCTSVSTLLKLHSFIKYSRNKRQSIGLKVTFYCIICLASVVLFSWCSPLIDWLVEAKHIIGQSRNGVLNKYLGQGRSLPVLITGQQGIREWLSLDSRFCADSGQVFCWYGSEPRDHVDHTDWYRMASYPMD